MHSYTLAAICLLGIKHGVVGYNFHSSPPPCDAEHIGSCYYAGDSSSFHLAFECNDKHQWVYISGINMPWKDYQDRMEACKWVDSGESPIFSPSDIIWNPSHHRDKDLNLERPFPSKASRDWSIVCDHGNCWYTQDTVLPRSTPANRGRQHPPAGYHLLDVITDETTGNLGFFNHLGKRVHEDRSKYYTRCKPGHNDIVEVFKGGKWHDYHKCESGGVCMDVEGLGACVWQHDHVVFIGPSGLFDSEEKRNSLDDPHVFPFAIDCDPVDKNRRCEFVDDGAPVHFNAKPDYDTRCALNGDPIVERFNGTEWEIHHVCERGAKCFDVNGQGSCVWQHDGHTRVWMQFGPQHHSNVPRYDTSEDIHVGDNTVRTGCDHSDEGCRTDVHIKRHTSDKTVRIDTRCTPGGYGSIDKFNGTEWNRVIDCPIAGGCVDLGGFAACLLGDAKYYVPGAQHLHVPPPALKRSLKQVSPPREPDLHSFDTRCNPKNLNEIQRFNGRKWVLHWTCPVEGSCKDVNGIGACWIGQTHYILPAANSSTDTSRPLDPARIHIHKRCKNEKIVELFTHTGWKDHTHCPAPYICEDFQDVGIAICVLPDAAVNKAVFLPLPPVDVKDDLGVRCLDERTLLQLVDNHDGSIHHVQIECPDNFKCHLSQKGDRAACMAPDLTFLNEYRHYLKARSLDMSPYNDPEPNSVDGADTFTALRTEGYHDFVLGDSLSCSSDSENSRHVFPKDLECAELRKITSAAMNILNSSHSIISSPHIERVLPADSVLPRFESMHARRANRPKRPDEEDGESD